MRTNSIVCTSLFTLQITFLSGLLYFYGLRKLHMAKFFVHKIVKTYLAFGLHEDFVGKCSLLNTCFSWGALHSSIGFLAALSTSPKTVIVFSLVEIWKSCTNTQILQTEFLCWKNKGCVSSIEWTVPNPFEEDVNSSLLPQIRLNT